MYGAKIIATAYINDEPMKDYLNKPIVRVVESSTDLPYESLGEAAGLALSAAWKTGIDPALAVGFHLVITFA